MIENPGIQTLQNLLTSIKSSGESLSSSLGAIVKAKVVDISEDGSALLRLISSSGLKGDLQGTLIKASSEVPLTKGQTVYLEITGDKGGIQMKFVGELPKAGELIKQTLPVKLLDSLVRLSETGLSNTESKQLLSMLKSLPQDLKNAFPDIKNLETLLQDTKQPGLRVLTADSARNLLTVKGQSDKALSINAGTVIKAEVVTVTEKGNAVLRVIASDGTDKNIQGPTLKTDLAVPLTKGQHIFLEILGGTNTLKMRIVSASSNSAEAVQQTFPLKFLEMFSQLSESRLDSSEFKFLLNLFRALPQSVRDAIPESQILDKMSMDVKQLDGKLLKAFIESSGVGFETRLKIAVLNDSGSMLHNLLALQSEGDLKSLLLKLKNLIKDKDIISTLKEAGFSISEIANTADKFIKNIEFYQFSSRLNEMFATFLPVLWDDLKDGEFIFQKGKGNRKGSYYCGINLDIESLGKLSISVTILNKAFYITFHAEEPGVANLIQSQKHLLEKGFASQGLTLKAININQKKDLAFGKTQHQGVSVKI